MPRNRRELQPSDLPRGPGLGTTIRALSAEWFEDTSTLKINFSGQPAQVGPGVPDVRVCDVNGTSFRTLSSVIAIGTNSITLAMAYDFEGANPNPGTVEVRSLTQMVRDAQGRPCESAAVLAFTNHLATAEPQVLVTFFENDASPRLVAVVNTRCDWTGGADNVVVNVSPGALIENTLDPTATVGARFEFAAFGASAEPDPGAGNVRLSDAIFTSTTSSLGSEAVVSAYHPLSIEPAPMPTIISITYLPDTLQVEIGFNVNVVPALADTDNAVRFCTSDGNEFMSNGVAEIVGDTATFNVVFNPDGALAPGFASTAGIGAICVSAANGRPAQDVSQFALIEDPSTAAPQLIDATYQLSDSKINLRYNVTMAAVGVDDTLSKVRDKRPGDSDSRHNAAGVALLVNDTVVGPIPVATVDNTVPVADTCVTTLFAGTILKGGGGSLNPVDVADFPMRLVP